MSRHSAALVLAGLTAMQPACSDDSKPRQPDEIVVATVTRCTAPRAAPVLPELPRDSRADAFLSKHPIAQLVNEGGRILPSPRVVAVFFGADVMRYQTDVLLQSYGCTEYWRDGVNQYGVGDALYARSVLLPATPRALERHSLPEFEQWLADSADRDAFGKLSDEHVLLFFLPPRASLLPDDCSERLGGHASVLTRSGVRIAYAYFVTCADPDSAALAVRTHAVTHELMEIATDPDPHTGPAWRSLGPGIVMPALRPSTTGADDEGADFCNDLEYRSLDYPFSTARNYSNRRARAGLHPCGSGIANPPLLAFQVPPETSVDLGSGALHVDLDVFNPDPAVTFRVYANAVLSWGTGDIWRDLLGGRSVEVRDAPVVSLDLAFAWQGGVALGANIPNLQKAELRVTTCPPGEEAFSSGCGLARLPISRLPPPPSSAGIPAVAGTP